MDFIIDIIMSWACGLRLDRVTCCRALRQRTTRTLLWWESKPTPLSSTKEIHHDSLVAWTPAAGERTHKMFLILPLQAALLP